MHLPVGTLLQGGRYEIIRYISSGGFGCTYEARDTKFKSRVKSVAIKEFFVNDFCNRDAGNNTVVVATQSKVELVNKLRIKFLEEANALYELEHPNIVRVTDTFEENGTAYYVMEYISGTTLAAIVDKEGSLSEDKALGYIRQVADALKYVHSHKRSHFDVKPQNIMVDCNDRAVLIDFGVSKQYDEVNGVNTSTLVGYTPGYAPMELTYNDIAEFSPTTDIYSLGATLFNLVTGTVPPSAGRVNEDGLPVPVDVSAQVFDAIKAAMQPRRKDRPQNIDEFLCLVENGNVKGENGKLVADESQSIDVVEVPDSADTVISNEGEKSHSADAVILSVSEESQSANNEILRSAQNDNSANGRQNDKDGNEEVERRNEKERSAGAVISNESEKSQKNKPGKSLWLILLLLLVAVAGAWFLFGGTGNGDAPKEKEPIAVEEQKAKEEKERLAAERRKNALVRDENELLCVACVDKNGKSILYFTGDEWKELSEDEKSNYPQLGVSIREDGHEFIIAASDCKGEYKFGGNDIDFEDVKNYESIDELDATFITTGYNDTRNIVKQTKDERDSEGISGAPAAEAAWKYEVNNHDPLQWYLPSYSELQMINRHTDDINRFLEDYFPYFTPIAEEYWSSTECSNKTSWYVGMYNGIIYSISTSRNHSVRVRAVASAK